VASYSGEACAAIPVKLESGTRRRVRHHDGMSPEPSPPVSAPSKPAQWLLFLACAIGGGLLGAAVAKWGLRSDGLLSIGCSRRAAAGAPGCVRSIATA
jgi:hypothetical protein